MTRLSHIDAEPVVRLFRALSDETRLRIVALLSHGELCVCHLEAALELPQPKVSRHLGVLKHAGVVLARREGSWVHYRLAPQQHPLAAKQLKGVQATYARSTVLRRDLNRLVKSKGPTCR
jgi:ArsR family transcriptional regulator